MRFWISAAAVTLAIGACGKSKNDKGGSDHASAPPAPDLIAPTTPVAKISGPSITPIVTSSITFVAPKDPAATWAELAFPCYRAAMELQPGSKASEAFYQVSPLIEPALHAADIDLDHDVAAIGGWSCGDGPCIYLALTLRHPEKIPDMLSTIPGVTPKQVAPAHWSFDAPGANGPRSIHIRVLPIQWGAALPADAWSQDMAKATHVMFITGMMGKGDVEPLAVLADGAAAAARVKDAEGVLTDARGLCVVGSVGPNDFKPGFKLDHARFAMAAPPGAGDPLTRLVGSSRTLDAELELSLTPAATEADFTGWDGEAREWIAGIADPIRMQLAGSGPIADAYFDMLRLVGTKGFQHKLAGRSLALSWRTDRIEQTDISAVEAELESAMGSSGSLSP